MSKPYYLAYEARYRAVYAAGMERWGHSPQDTALIAALHDWTEQNSLRGKQVIDFACGEGACGEILSELGCYYLGVDISPTVTEKTAKTLEKYPNARVAKLDMVNERADGTFEAAVDCMGFHMLVLDADREKYLQNAFGCLLPGAPMIFFRQLHDENALEARVETIQQWLELTGSDYKTLYPYTSGHKGGSDEIQLPRVPGRSRSKEQFISELALAGFTIEAIVDMPENTMCPHSVTIYARKPR